MPDSTSAPHLPAQVALAVVFQIRDDELQVLLWERARDPSRGAWSLPGGALGPLRDIYAAALGYDVSATNLKRVLLRRGAIETTGERRTHGPAGGRPAEAFRFRTSRLEVTDPFAVLRPPTP